ncbi:hypothetical protein FB451DRAFT_1164600 [Mycena latifolia]|nr:hypothetical protein FB451DRAFT_1164600 [Mycena latifolia]
MNLTPSSAITRAEDPSSAQPAPSQAQAFPPPPGAGYYTFVPYPVAAPAPAAADSGAAATIQAVANNSAPPATAVAQPVSAATAPLPAVANIPNPHIVTGIPPGLASLLRWTGPWSANVIYSVAPTGPLAPIEEPIPAPEWYCITRGRFLGVIDQYAMAHFGIRNVSNAAHKSYTTQVYALEAFNKVVLWGGIEVV